MNNNFKSPKNEEIIMKIIYNYNKIDKYTILNDIFSLKGNEISYNNSLKEKITGTIKIVSEELNENNLKELIIKANLIYDQRTLDFDLYLLGIQSLIENKYYHFKSGIKETSIDHNGVRLYHSII